MSKLNIREISLPVARVESGQGLVLPDLQEHLAAWSHAQAVRCGQRATPIHEVTSPVRVAKPLPRPHS